MTRDRRERRHSTGSRRLLLASTALTAALFVAPSGRAQPPMPAPNATPQGGRVVGGQASIAQAPGATTITQSSQRAALDWQSFNVGSNARVTFNQPSAQAIALNRVVSEDPSVIAGRIDANGQIVLMNQSGVVFTRGSQVNAESLVVSTSGISAKNFMAGKLDFDSPPHPGARIVNDGRITMKQAGLAAFVAPQVVNRGVIIARLGHVVLAGASAFTLDISGDGLVSIDVTRAVRKIDLGGRTVDALVTNTGTIIADGGTVTLTARAVDGLIQQLLDVRGVVQADSVGRSSGGITIQGIGGDLQVAGNLLARGTQVGSQGGTIGIDATGNVSIASTARIDASGDSGGGVVALGTDAARAIAGPTDTSAPKAATVTIAKGATIAADATRSGTGGRITVLSANQTTQDGALSAKGDGGLRGGTIETSSDGVVSLSGTETVISPHGASGEILLDPATLFVEPGHSGAAAGSTSSVSGGVTTTTIGLTNTGTSYIDPAILDALSGTIILDASRLISVQSAVAMSNASAVTLDSGGDISITASMNIGGSLEIDATGTIAIGAQIQAGTQLALLAGSTVSEAAGGVIVAPTLTTDGGSIGGDALLGNVNTIDTLGAFDTSGDFTLNDSGTLLTIGGSLDAASATLIGAGLNFTAPVSVANTLALASTGGITQTSAGAITAGTLTSDGGTITGGDALLNGTANTIDTLGAFNASGNIALDDTGTPLAIAGSLGAASATLIGDGLVFGAPVSVAGILALASTGGITQTAGAIAAGTLTSDSGTITGGDVLLGDAGNAIATLGTFNASGNFTLNDPGTPLAITGSLGAASATLIGDGLNFGGAASIAGLLALSSAAGITETGTGTISAGTLTSDGTIAGNALFGSTGNAIGTLGAFTATGNLLLQDGTDLNVAGALGAASIALIDAQALTLSSALSVGTGGAIDLIADRMIDSGASFTAPSGTIALAPFTPSTPIDFGGSAAGELAIAPSFATALAASGETDFILGRMIIGATTYTAGPIAIEGSLPSFAGTLDIVALGGIANSADLQAVTLSLSGTSFGGSGAIAATDLSGSFSGAASLTNSLNAIGTVTGLIAGGGIRLADSAPLTLGGTLSVASGAAIDLTADAISLANAGTIIAPDGTVGLAPLTAGKAIAVGGSSSGAFDLPTALLSAIAPTAATLIIGDSLSGSLDVLGAVDFPILDIVLHGAGIAIDASLSAAQTLDLESTAGISETAGLSAGTLIGAASAAVSLTGANAIATLGNFTATGNAIFNDATPLLIAGSLTVPGTIAF
ncbi:beta strand repeat-containing protein, partial [Acidiphilium iwatense]